MVFTSTSQAESLTASISQGFETEVQGTSPQSAHTHYVAEGAGVMLYTKGKMPSYLNVFNV